ncbi:hypothetical protein KC318_g6070 [Hortaea werneckii]|uniref:Core Histone H2A/H2B/H3 domain-containing protein n=1 Tax=Hortaea werneckii TaxID=91943 RepID=A0A3M6YXF6_HORWE|nr:hypothetical protein KC334_g6215 [Hortaea werneckii]KAI7010617.1 hypothetical protein KC355_g6106 [Hortaea werneckii]KAI7667145.1 hypothetical protein KC318_g6070 [Hortaea werneckii]RMY07529.1 hypothetical protein D0867_09317 [Hortaea werneckii]RMY36405.1 hypothetical protein D0866_03960 [Hortaea werneckii]
MAGRPQPGAAKSKRPAVKFGPVTLPAPRKKLNAATRQVQRANASTTNNRRKQQYKLGTVALKESRRNQKSTDNVIPNRPFQRLVDEVTVGLKNEIRFQASAMDTLQEAAEAYMVHIFECTKLAARHTKRDKIKKEDMELAVGLLRSWGVLE